MKWLIGFGLLFSRERSCFYLPPETAVLRGGEGRALASPVPESRGLGFSDSGVRVLGARRCRTAGFSRDSGAQRFRREIPRSREPQNPAPAAEAAGPEPATRPPRRPEGTGELVVCVSRRERASVGVFPWAPWKALLENTEEDALQWRASLLRAVQA